MNHLCQCASLIFFQAEPPALVPPKAGMAWPRKPRFNQRWPITQIVVISCWFLSQETAGKLLKSLTNLQKIAAALNKSINLEEDAAFLKQLIYTANLHNIWNFGERKYGTSSPRVRRGIFPESAKFDAKIFKATL